MNPKYSTWDQELQLKNVEIWNADGVLANQDVHIANGIVKSMTPSQEKGKSKILIPAGVDTQVHLRVPGQPEKETAESGIKAALHGGVGAFLNMPNTKPLIDTVEALKLGQKEVEAPAKKWGIDVLFSACVSVGQKGEVTAPIRELFDAGAVAFTDDGRGVGTEKVMDEAFAILEKLGAPLLQHAEMPGAEGPLAPGPMQTKLGLKPYDAKLETDMVERDLRLLEKHPKARYHLLHVSSRHSIPLMKKAKDRGFIVTSEVTPHHLYFCSDDITEENKSFKMNPPIRGADDKSALVEALNDGLIDWMATDHAPHEESSKTKSFSDATFGTVGLETSLQVLLELYQKGKLSKERLVKVWSSEPAKFLGIDDEYGEIKVGKPFRAVLVDIEPKTKINPNELWGLSKNTCFAGSELPGKILGHATKSGFFNF